MKHASRSSLTALVGKHFRLAPNGLFRQSLIAAFVASLLSSCGVLKNPESVVLEIPANTSDFRSRLYAGASIGNSQLNPDTDGPGFAVSSDSDAGTQLRLGYDVHNMLAVELDTSVLGSATLRNQSSGLENADVKFTSASVSALVYGWSGVQMRSRRQGLSAYGRFGFSSLNRSSAVVDLDESGVVPIVGIGAEYGFVNGLGIRTEITRFDSDATYFGVGAVYRFSISPRGIGRLVAEAAEPALNRDSTRVVKRGESPAPEIVVERYAGSSAHSDSRVAPYQYYTSGTGSNVASVGSIANRWRPAIRSDDKDSDSVLDHVDSCPGTQRFVTVNGQGCGLFDAVLHDVTFKSGSHWLTPRARGQLDLVAEALLTFPEARIQVRAHTDSQGAADINLGLSSRRAEVVVQYLQSKGVGELQLQAVGMGETQPLFANNTKKGRLRNRRIDVITLPDQDAGHLLVAQNIESGAVMSVQNMSGIDLTEEQFAGDDWNSAPNPKKPSRTAGPETPPGLLAANPVPAERASKVSSLAAGLDSLVMPQLAALPKPGFAPDFPVFGVLDGVRFKQAQNVLSNDSEDALRPLLKALKRNQSVKIAVMAHTDSKGSAEANKLLSTQRAEAVVEHLVSNGVDALRLRAEGYGELLPLVQNVTESDRDRNRRIEIRVLPSE